MAAVGEDAEEEEEEDVGRAARTKARKSQMPAAGTRDVGGRAATEVACPSRMEMFGSIDGREKMRNASAPFK